MSIKGKLEAIIYATEEPVTLDQLAVLVKEDVLAALAQERHAAAEGDQGDAELAQTEPSCPIEVSSETSAPGAPPKSADDVRKREKKAEKDEYKLIKARINTALDELIADCANSDRGIEIRQIAGGYRMATKPEHHDLVRAFAKNLKPPVRLSLQALETLSVIAYKQPITVPEINEIRGVDAGGVIGTLLDRKLITTAGRKQVIGRPILYKTTKEFLTRFGLADVSELPSMEEFEKIASEGQESLFTQPPQQAVPAQEVTEATESQPEESRVASNE
jgi:segregation and condensation protein B